MKEKEDMIKQEEQLNINEINFDDLYVTFEKVIAKLNDTLRDVFQNLEKYGCLEECMFYSESELKKKIKYANNPMEAKHYNKMLNKRRKIIKENKRWIELLK